MSPRSCAALIASLILSALVALPADAQQGADSQAANKEAARQAATTKTLAQYNATLHKQADVSPLPTPPEAAPVSAAHPARERRQISVFVGPQIRDGFVDIDRGVLDSIKDIKAELRGKALRVVADRDQADLTLEVLSRGATSTNGGGSVGLPIGTMTFVLPVGTIGLATVLRAGAYEKPIVFQNCGAWRECAELVVKDLDTWIAANAAAIISK